MYAPGSSHKLRLAGPLAIILALALLMFRDVLFFSRDQILSREGLDLAKQFIYWRDFGFSQLRLGNLPLWNPHLFSGMPFLGGFQSALLYPPNYLHLFLPLPLAINIGILLHTVLLGFFMYLWAASRGITTLGSLLAAVIVMFSGPYFLHIYAGHLPNLYSMIWMPLIFFALERIIRQRSPGWLLTGIFALTMQVLAGHPQYVYYTCLTAAIYTCLLLSKAEKRLSALLALLVLFAGAGALGAVQMLSGWQAAAESVRSLGVSFQFASLFSLAPESFTTWLSPWFFGDMINFPYWGRFYLWEMSLYIGITGFALALYGVFCSSLKGRLLVASMVIILLILALGANTPLFALLYDRLPGWDKFRGTAKFIFPATLFLALLAGAGMDELMKDKRRQGALAALLLAGALLLAAGAFLAYLSSTGGQTGQLWQKLVGFPVRTGESYLMKSVYLDPSFPREAARFSAGETFLAAAVAMLLSLLIFSLRYSRKSLYLVALVAVFEVFVFAQRTQTSFPPASALNAKLAEFYRTHPGDYRVLNLLDPNSAMALGAADIWGYDPGVPLRYAQFIAFTQGEDPDRVTQYMGFKRYHPLYRMLRCRYVIMPGDGGLVIREMPEPLPRLQLVKDWQAFPRRSDVFRALENPGFDPSRTVILERAPRPAPDPVAGEGTVVIEESTTDSLLIRAKLSRAMILLITDTYSSGWRVRPLPGSIQRDYEVLPANYTLMALPLQAGEHRLLMEYKPAAFITGKWISFFALSLYIIALIRYLKNHRRKNRYCQ